MAVAAAGVRLPDLDQRVPHGTAVAVEQPPVNDDPLADGLAVMLPSQVAVELADPILPVDRAGDLRQRVGHRDERSLRRAGTGGDVVGIEIGRIDLEVVTAIAGHSSVPGQLRCHRALLDRRPILGPVLMPVPPASPSARATPAAPRPTAAPSPRCARRPGAASRSAPAPARPKPR